MAVATTGNKIFRYGDDNNTVWPFPYPVPEARDIKVIVTPPGGDDQYISPNLFQVDGIDTGAITVTYPLSGTPLPMGWKITILRELELLSDFDPDNGTALNAEEVTDQLDRQLMMIQQQQEQLGRAMVLPASEETDFVRMVETVVRESRQVEEYYNLIQETAGTFESATETQRGTGYVATAGEAENFTTEPRDPAGHAFLTPETGKILVDKVTAGIGLGTAAIDRLGTVRIAKQSEVTNGVTETGRSPAVVRPEEYAVAHAESHRITHHLYLTSGTFVPDANGYITNLILISAGASGAIHNSGAGSGRGGFLYAHPNIIKVTRGTQYPIVIGAPSAGVSSAFGFAADTTGMLHIPAVTGRQGGSGPTGDKVFVAFLTCGIPGTGGAESSEFYRGPAGGSAGWYLPGVTENLIPIKGTNSTQASRVAKPGTGLGAGGPGGFSGSGASSPGRGSQGGVFFIFVRHPGGL